MGRVLDFPDRRPRDRPRGTARHWARDILDLWIATRHVDLALQELWLVRLRQYAELARRDDADR